MEITLVVTVQVSSADEDACPLDIIKEERIAQSVQQGVEEALNHANNRGYNHPMANHICMNVLDVSVDL